VIRGRVFVADTGHPLRRARITVSAPELGTDSRQISTSPDGKYEIKDLPPPGEYLAVAVDYVQDGMWNDPEYLDSIRRHAQRFALGESDARTVGLKITAVESP